MFSVHPRRCIRVEPQPDACREHPTATEAPAPLGRVGPTLRAAEAGRSAHCAVFPAAWSCRLTRDIADGYEGWFEYWDTATETAWAVAEPTCGAHERPPRRLAALYEVVACLRGGPIECRGSVDLIRNAGEPHRRCILQADEEVAPPGAGADTGRGD